jgi:hypothetical protein
MQLGVPGSKFDRRGWFEVPRSKVDVKPGPTSKFLSFLVAGLKPGQALFNVEPRASNYRQCGNHSV